MPTTQLLPEVTPPRLAARASDPPVLPVTGSPPARQLVRYTALGPGRAAAEQRVREVFLARYGAHVQQFAPVLVGLHDGEDRLLAVAGYRPADTGPLFLERYLSQPIQSLLADGSAPAPGRQRIVEVGHLAALQAGEGRALIARLGPMLLDSGFDWVVCTLTQELRSLFLRLGVATRALGVADPAVLPPDEAAAWGTYYDHRPVVLAGSLQAARQRLQARGVWQ
jgi:hypothetical protein